MSPTNGGRKGVMSIASSPNTEGKIMLNHDATCPGCGSAEVTRLSTSVNGAPVTLRICKACGSVRK